jgi:hypothetical protein
VSKPAQPARVSARIAAGSGEFESVEFAKRHDKGRRRRDLARQARKRQRG